MATELEERIYRVEVRRSGSVSLIRAKSPEQARLKFLYSTFEVSSRPATEDEVKEFEEAGGQIW